MDEPKVEEVEAEVVENPGDWSARSRLGRKLHETGQLQRAIEEYEQAIRIAPREVDLYLDLAAVYRTANLAVERMPFVDRYVLLLGQHIGAPAKAVVKAGDRVERGQPVAEAGGYVSTTLHSPVTGKTYPESMKYDPETGVELLYKE